MSRRRQRRMTQFKRSWHGAILSRLPPNAPLCNKILCAFLKRFMCTKRGTTSVFGHRGRREVALATRTLFIFANEATGGGDDQIITKFTISGDRDDPPCTETRYMCPHLDKSKYNVSHELVKCLFRRPAQSRSMLHFEDYAQLGNWLCCTKI